MTQVTFSDRWLQSLKADAVAEFSDSVCPNLRLRVGRRSKTFSVMIGPAGRPPPGDAAAVSRPFPG